jgi:hypothetical protein
LQRRPLRAPAFALEFAFASEFDLFSVTHQRTKFKTKMAGVKPAATKLPQNHRVTEKTPEA